MKTLRQYFEQERDSMQPNPKFTQNLRSRIDDRIASQKNRTTQEPKLNFSAQKFLTLFFTSFDMKKGLLGLSIFALFGIGSYGIWHSTNPQDNFTILTVTQAKEKITQVADEIKNYEGISLNRSIETRYSPEHEKLLEGTTEYLGDNRNGNYRSSFMVNYINREKLDLVVDQESDFARYITTNSIRSYDGKYLSEYNEYNNLFVRTKVDLPQGHTDKAIGLAPSGLIIEIKMSDYEILQSIIQMENVDLSTSYQTIDGQKLLVISMKAPDNYLAHSDNEPAEDKDVLTKYYFDAENFKLIRQDLIRSSNGKEYLFSTTTFSREYLSVVDPNVFSIDADTLPSGTNKVERVVDGITGLISNQDGIVDGISARYIDDEGRTNYGEVGNSQTITLGVYKDVFVNIFDNKISDGPKTIKLFEVYVCSEDESINHPEKCNIENQMTATKYEYTAEAKDHKLEFKIDQDESLAGIFPALKIFNEKGEEELSYYISFADKEAWKANNNINMALKKIISTGEFENEYVKVLISNGWEILNKMNINSCDDAGNCPGITLNKSNFEFVIQTPYVSPKTGFITTNDVNVDFPINFSGEKDQECTQYSESEKFGDIEVKNYYIDLSKQENCNQYKFPGIENSIIWIGMRITKEGYEDVQISLRPNYNLMNSNYPLKGDKEVNDLQLEVRQIVEKTEFKK